LSIAQRELVSCFPITAFPLVSYHDQKTHEATNRGD